MIARIYHLLEWVMKLLFLNLLWIGFTLIGFGVFGLFPSTVAMFQLIMDLINKKDTKMVATFWNSYQSNFKNRTKWGFHRFNRFDTYDGSLFFQMYDTLVSRVLSLMSLSMLLFYVVNLLYIIQTFNHFEVKHFIILNMPHL